MVGTKRGYLFIIDAFIALTVLVAGFFIVFTFYTEPSYAVQQDILAQDIIEHLTSATVDAYVSGNINLTNQYYEGEIFNLRHSVAEELMLDLYYRSAQIGPDCTAADTNPGCILAADVMQGFDASQYNIKVELEIDGKEAVYYEDTWFPEDQPDNYVVREQMLYASDFKQIGDSEFVAQRPLGPGMIRVMVW